MGEQFMRERGAKRRLERLQTLQPSGAAPLTNEDLAIYGMFLQQKNKDVFTRYIISAYPDYFVFFISEVTRAMNRELEKFT